MSLRPSTRDELAQTLRAAAAAGRRMERVDLGALNRIVEHTPEDMTVTVEAGLTLAVLQDALARHGQWLPLDPPHPDRLTIAELLSTNASEIGRASCRERV